MFFRGWIRAVSRSRRSNIVGDGTGDKLVVGFAMDEMPKTKLANKLLTVARKYRNSPAGHLDTKLIGVRFDGTLPIVKFGFGRHVDQYWIGSDWIGMENSVQNRLEFGITVGSGPILIL